ncbi:hypothetical protein SAMN05421823_108160 [Catalinimonas alkaloidigena]|uniref:Outer membrane protein beta-barrel domain-containing protein n=1 Tax=Catalinimonas alkaloidigena TaxID=1075417 RepID=A0A1G9N2D5_9BACT|nr:hypothetical protein [Catalinimonas alkaloidigena]SDL80670.1 hypothetical protein SAMN05421823_108160 [Catalinimonas alkaloidigena]
MRTYYSLLLLMSVCALWCSNPAQAQYYDEARSQTVLFTAPDFYLGLGTGFNGPVGLIGPQAEYRFANKLTVAGGLGLGSWGYKMTGGVRFYPSYPSKLAFNAGVSYCTGLPKFETELDTLNGPYRQGSEVTLRLKPTATFNLSGLYFWSLGKTTRLGVEFGYAFSLRDRAYETLDGSQLSYESALIMDLLQPGGLILALSLMFGS